VREIVRATCGELRATERQLKSRKRSRLRIAVAYLSRRDALLNASQFGVVLGVRHAAASKLAVAGEARHRADESFREQIDRIRARIERETTAMTGTSASRIASRNSRPGPKENETWPQREIRDLTPC